VPADQIITIAANVLGGRVGSLVAIALMPMAISAWSALRDKGKRSLGPGIHVLAALKKDVDGRDIARP
jgi:hypothetical protein